ncbi:MAG: 2-C-methyl-D-erythritol 4-phosphate cytidylyltransferase [Prevotellaceae bacterium]|jgi:2-C-methyl-D-erythritol 4-phosphate cytidylyltransferase|nr:2-C-methyl-D-erythritol 4-phosphate cytidylyltransferase [Prevotellaceae bacterium]
MNVAVILAGGTGSRMGGTLPKQFLTVAGRSVIEYAIDTFDRHAQIDEIAVVCHADYLEEMGAICRRNRWSKVKRLLTGGKERYHSSLQAIETYAAQAVEVKANADTVNLLLHDAARPLVSSRIITDCVEALRRYEAVGVAVPATDTIVETTEADNLIARVTDRRLLRHMQTPQCFRLNTIARAYRLALTDPDFHATDDCGVVLRYLPQVPVYLVHGEHTNLKITYPEEMFLIEKLVTST